MTFTSEPTKLLPYLHKRFEEAGGKLLRRKVESFEELEGFDLIVNCTGMGSLELVKDASNSWSGGESKSTLDLRSLL